jgi:hypothetical protein
MAGGVGDSMDGDAIIDEIITIAESSFALIKHTVAPWSEVIRHWSESFDERQALFVDCTSPHEYLSKFPCMENQNAHELVRV